MAGHKHCRHSESGLESSRVLPNSWRLFSICGLHTSEPNDDFFVEGDETVNIALSNPTGAGLGSPNKSELTIADNDSTPPTTNPIDGNMWIVYLQANPGDFRTMVNGFVNSAEYRQRFGPS